ncbi:MAG: hypothetical protein ACRDSN_25420, partial [Pseudonocardiaceae bacterium]
MSRGRKGKKSNKSTPGRPRAGQHDDLVRPPRPGFTALQSLLAPRRRPDWFEPSIKAVLDRAGVVMAVRGPRELEQS